MRCQRAMVSVGRWLEKGLVVEVVIEYAGRVGFVFVCEIE